MSNQPSTTVNVTIASPQKSMVAAILLTLFFGPLGLFYASITGGLIMLAAYAVVLVLSFVTFGMATVLFPLLWIVTIVWAVLGVQGKDQLVLTQVKSGNFAGAVKSATEQNEEA